MDCSVAKALSVVGDRWTMLVLRETFFGTRRFEEFLTRTAAPRAILTERLKALVDEGVLDRRPMADRPDRHEYRLTEKGIDLYPVIVSLMHFGDKWLTDGEAGPPVVLQHKACGHVVMPELACPHCGAFVTARDFAASGRATTVSTAVT